MKILFFCILKVTEDFVTDPDPLVRGTDPKIRIRTKMSWIWLGHLRLAPTSWSRYSLACLRGYFSHLVLLCFTYLVFCSKTNPGILICLLRF
jgi:hypothetical protein